MNISFIIPTYNSRNCLDKCIVSVLQETEKGDEILVIDNGSDDDSLVIAKSYTEVVVHSKKDCNVSAVRNFGAIHSENKILAFVDSDCILKTGWRKAVLKTLGDETIHATGCKYEIPPIDANWIEKAWFAQRNYGIVDVNYINSGNFAIKRDVFTQLKGFDERLITGEDTEFCFRLKSSGYRIVSNENAGAIHLGNPKSLVGFFKKQYWHSLGMFGTFKLQKLDKPLFATILFIACTFLSLALLSRSSIIFCFLLNISIPLTASLYRIFQYRLSVSKLLFLFILYYIYFCARSLAFSKLLLDMIFVQKKCHHEFE